MRLSGRVALRAVGVRPPRGLCAPIHILPGLVLISLPAVAAAVAAPHDEERQEPLERQL